MRIKICGITKVDQGIQIAQFGATALGFMCVSNSPRFITAEQICAIIKKLPQNIDKIGVFANAEIESIQNITYKSGLTGVQLHGDETPEFCQVLRESLPNMEIIKALRIRNAEQLKQVDRYSNCVDSLLLDAYHPQQLGGTGQTLDWEILQEFQPPLPWFLAGGLKPDNILQALNQVRPNGIDLSSGVERAPGDKDLDKVAMLLEKLGVRSCYS